MRKYPFAGAPLADAHESSAMQRTTSGPTTLEDCLLRAKACAHYGTLQYKVQEQMQHKAGGEACREVIGYATEAAG